MFLLTLLITIPIIVSSDHIKERQILVSIDNAVLYVRERNLSSQYFAEETVCYEQLGCFSTHGPLSHIGYLPDSPEHINTRFFVYTKTNCSEIFYDNENSWHHIPNGTALAIIIHGFGMDSNSLSLVNLKDALLSEIPTIIVTDWHKGSDFPDYANASVNTQIVGRQIALLVNKLKDARNINPQNVHLLGFSLGSQVSGFAGKWSQQMYNWKFGRITAMDTAAPLFEGYSGAYVTHEDANFVDAIHTNAGYIGFSTSYGHIDFYPNGGELQPRCTFSSLNLSSIISGIMDYYSCNHNSAVHYMDASLKSVSQCQFLAYKCISWNEFNTGECNTTKSDSRLGYFSINYSGRGDHFLRTYPKYPYCNGNHHGKSLNYILIIVMCTHIIIENFM